MDARMTPTHPPGPPVTLGNMRELRLGGLCFVEPLVGTQVWQPSARIEIQMSDSPSLKIDQAEERITELNELFQKKRPFGYFVETNTQTGERATFAKRDRIVVSKAAVICGKIVHHLRSALDHAYWDIVSPFANTDQERKRVQFPFCQSAGRIEIFDRMSGFPEIGRRGNRDRPLAKWIAREREELSGDEINETLRKTYFF
jgi:hypothetical protein